MPCTGLNRFRGLVFCQGSKFGAFHRNATRPIYNDAANNVQDVIVTCDIFDNMIFLVLTAIIVLVVSMFLHFACSLGKEYETDRATWLT